MFANYLIGLREGLEAALIVSILIAYLVRTDRRDQIRPVWFGVAAALGLSIGFGALLTYTETSLLSTGAAQETFGGTLSIIAVGFVTWMIFWMRSAARGIGRELQGRLDSAVAIGSAAVVLMAFLAVAREGLETALFLFSAIQAAGSTTAPLTGFVLGLATAVGLAYGLYRRAVTINLARFFRITGLLLIFVAGGVLAYGVHDLQEGGVLPGLNNLAFDVSSTIPPSSWYGTLLKGIFNFSPQTTVLQAVVWVGYVVPVLFFFLRPTRPKPIEAPAEQVSTTA